MRFVTASVAALVGALLAVNVVTPAAADIVGTLRGVLGKGDQKSPFQSDEFATFATQFMEVTTGTIHCEFEWDERLQDKWLDDAFKLGSYGRKNVQELFVVSMSVGSIADDVYWNADEPEQTCKAIGDKYGANGTVRKGVLTGSGKPR